MAFALNSSSEESLLSRGETSGRAHAAPGKPATGRPVVTQGFSFPDCRFTIGLWSDGHIPPDSEFLVHQAYSRLGYRSLDPTHDVAGCVATLQAGGDGKTRGTLAINFDGPRGLQADALYPQELAQLRGIGRVCEFTRLALDRSSAGREVLCSLFYMAYAYAHFIRGIDHLVIEVNPRHEAFYRRMLGFRRCGERRLCPRVIAPAVLMHLDFRHTRELIERARRDQKYACAALYRFALPAAEEVSLIRRMRQQMHV